MKPIYLDYSATTPVRPEVLDAMLPFLIEEFANSGSIHRAKDAIERARKQIARAIGASSPRKIIFTGSGTEANNLAIIGAARQRKSQENHTITTQFEHPAVLEPCRYLEKEGFEVTYLPVDSYGSVSVEDVKSAITDQTILISIMAANRNWRIGSGYSDSFPYQCDSIFRQTTDECGRMESGSGKHRQP